MNEGAWDELKQAARLARSHAYAPYSGFTVGAAVRTKSGAVFTGCNVENASYGATICAERAALAAAVAAGERELAALVIASGARRPTPPCGICRQCLSELAPSLPIRSYTGDAHAEYDLASLLPHAFSRDQLD
ncbi:MAG: cytidine deaminase [Deltaproteobacteria bacterium]|nr:cytidine deaminase [Deltaproteobacteria bacterium]MBW1875032.1 cytidine deaminase [Deltaproteobacteria bacterium]MBW2210732.1 cytidine deaminase [Deltaproteobacteria bacterium]MBW2213119.1 cytidine deaminase [Deltaproteobacteria bacterium]MBW2379040.1 cytidine deaminase [Deltaproteobacteria bacterium]